MNVNDILKMHWDYKLPVKPKRIARSLGLEVKKFPMSEIDDRHPDYGLSGNSKWKVVSLYATTTQTNRKFARDLRSLMKSDTTFGTRRFLSGSRFTFQQNSNDYREVQANRFAAQLLMPKIAIDFMIRKRRMTKLRKLADIFGVSQVAMDYRLQNLGWY